MGRNGDQQGTDDETGCREFDFHGQSFSLRFREVPSTNGPAILSSLRARKIIVIQNKRAGNNQKEKNRSERRRNTTGIGSYALFY
jgi:hypothetical protein